MSDTVITNDPKIQDALRTLANAASESGLIEFTSTCMNVSISDEGNPENYVTFTLVREPVDVITSLYKRLRDIDPSDENFKEKRIALRNYLIPLVDDIVLGDAVIVTIAHAIVANYKAHDEDGANAIISLFLKAKVTDKTKTFISKFDEVIAEVYSIGESGETFDPISIIDELRSIDEDAESEEEADENESETQRDVIIRPSNGEDE